MLYSEPGAAGRWLRIGQELRGESITSVWTWSENPTMVLAAAERVLFHSADGGMSWQPISDAPSGLLAGSKADPATVTCLASHGELFRSSDAGATWALIGSLGVVHSAGTRVFIAAPDDRSALYAAIDDQVLASTDQGATWKSLGKLPGHITSLTVLANRASLYAQADGKLYQHTDDTWKPIDSTRQLTGPLVVLAGREPTLLAALDSSEIGRSTDGGATWEPSGAEISWGAGPQVLVAAPYHMDIAFAGGGPAVALSVDRGRTWQRLKGDAVGVRAIAVARLV